MTQFIKYCGVATTSALFDWLLYSLLIFTGTHYLGAQVCSRLGGGVWAFIANKYWSFGKRRVAGFTVEGRRFSLLYLISYLFSLSLIWFFVEIIRQNEFLGKLISDTVCFFINFLLMKVYVFNTRVGMMGRLKSLVQRF